MRAYRITITIDTYENETDLRDENTEPIKSVTNCAISDNYLDATTVISKALAIFKSDPSHGTEWY